MRSTSTQLAMLTAEDRRIVDELPIQAAATYRVSDAADAVRARCAIATFGSYVAAVAAYEDVRRSIERGRPA